MYTAHVHFFTNLDLFCIDNARVIYRKIRYYVNKQSIQLSTDSPRFATVRFETIHYNDCFENRGLKFFFLNLREYPEMCKYKYRM